MRVVKLALTAAIAILLIVGCNNGLQDNNSVSNVTVSLNDNFRTILPDLGIEKFSKIEISAESNGQTTGTVLVGEGRQAVLTVPYGSCEIIATAYLKVGETDYAAVRDSVSLNVSQPSHSVTILLDTPTPGGEGTFAYNIEFPAGAVVSVTLENYPLGNGSQFENVLVTASGTTVTVEEKSPSGFYFFTVTAVVDGKTYTQSDIVHIYHARTSTAEFSFVDEEVVIEVEEDYRVNNYNKLTSSVSYQIVNLPLENRDNVMKIDGSTLAENTAHVAVFWLPKEFQAVKITFSADVKRVGAAGTIDWQINNAGSYPSLSRIIDAEEGVWYQMNGTWTGTPTDVDYPMFYLSTFENNSEETIFYIDNFQIEVENIGNPGDIVLVFTETDNWEENATYAKWQYLYSLELDEKIEADKDYIFRYAFTANRDLSNNPIGIQLIDNCEETGYDWIELSDWTYLVGGNLLADTLVEGALPVKAHTAATNATPNANRLVLFGDRSDEQLILIFTEFEFIEVEVEPSIENWNDFDIVDAGLRTVATELPSYEGETNVLHIKPHTHGAYNWNVITYLLGEKHDAWIGESVKIELTAKVFLPEAAKISFEINDADLDYPTIMGSKATPLSAGEWHPLSGSFVIELQETHQVLLSGGQLENAEVYFADLAITVTLAGDEESDIGITITDAFSSNSNISLTSLASVTRGNNFTASISFTNPPSGASIGYTWIINGENAGTTNSLTYATGALTNKVNYGTVIVTINGTPYSKSFEFYVE